MTDKDIRVELIYLSLLAHIIKNSKNYKNQKEIEEQISFRHNIALFIDFMMGKILKFVFKRVTFYIEYTFLSEIRIYSLNKKGFNCNKLCF